MSIEKDNLCNKDDTNNYNWKYFDKKNKELKQKKESGEDSYNYCTALSPMLIVIKERTN